VEDVKASCFQSESSFSMNAKKERIRARDLGVPFEGETGLFNAITDVNGVQVGHSTIISGEGELVVGKGPVRTGVSAVLPRGRSHDAVFAGWYSLNGNGEMTGTTWVEESGFLEGPVMITNTHSIGVVHDAVIEWMNWNRAKNREIGMVNWSLPVVAETYDGYLNDINGFHVKREHTFEALKSAASGWVMEGNVGGGTGMICHQFKGGIGTSSRILSKSEGGFTVGVIVQANYGLRPLLTIAGVPVGREIPDLLPEISGEGSGSIIIIVATDAPLLPHQMKRLARRAPLGISRVGGVGGDGSGDIFIAFSTANPNVHGRNKVSDVRMLSNDLNTGLFLATVQATEEAIVNALVAAETMRGINNNMVHALPHNRLKEALRKFNRLNDQ
jgi:L-aminopeptidase/D-esterase-like protein